MTFDDDILEKWSKPAVGFLLVYMVSKADGEGVLSTSLREIERDTGFNTHVIREALAELGASQKVRTDSARRNTCITIVDIDGYRGNSNDGARRPHEVRTESEPVKTEKKKRGFIPPTVDEVQAYLSEKGIDGIDAQEFVDFYGASGWMRGKTKITNWKLCVSTWNTKRREEQSRRMEPKPADDRPLYVRFNEWVEKTFPNLRDCEPLSDEAQYNDVVAAIGGNKALEYTMGQLNNESREGRLYDVIKDYCGGS